MSSNNSLFTLDKAIEKFLIHLKNKNRSSNTIIAYENDINQLADFVKKYQITKADNVKEQQVKKFKKYLSEEKKYTNKTISRKLNSVKSFFKFLTEAGIVADNPASNISHPKIKQKPPRILSPMEYRSLRDVCRDDARTHTIIQLMLQAGLRISEVSNLRLSDIQEDKIIIRAYESHKGRVIPLNKAAQEAIKNYKKVRLNSRKSQNFFITRNGNRLLIRNIRSSINRYYKIAGIKGAYINTLRDTFAVQQLEAGVPINIVSKIIGHKRVSSTEKYLEMIEEKKSDQITLKEL